METLMRTTLNIDARILAEYKKLAAETHHTLSYVIQDALRGALDAQQRADRPAVRDLPVFHGEGVQQGVDLDETSAVLDRIDEADGVFEDYRRYE
jgi:hypothetical protein